MRVAEYIQKWTKKGEELMKNLVQFVFNPFLCSGLGYLTDHYIYSLILTAPNIFQNTY